MAASHDRHQGRIERTLPNPLPVSSELVPRLFAPTEEWPDGMELIRQAREALGLFAGAMPVTPQQAWEEALERMRWLAAEPSIMRRDAANADYSNREWPTGLA